MAFDGPDGYAVGLESLARLVEPRRALAISDWSAAHRVLTSKSSSEPGRWRNERIPFLVDVMNALDPRHPAPIVVLKKSSQVGGSECGLNWVGRTVHMAPGSFLVLFPTDRVARKWVRTRLDSMIATTPAIRALMPLGRRTNAGNTLSEKHFPGGVLYTGSANIPDDVASISVPYLLLEEIDRMPAALIEEGDPIELALRRSTTFPRSKAFLNSTPTLAETSRIDKVWATSTKDRYYVPCTHCGHFQYLRWQQLQWVSGKTSSAAYICEVCGAANEERHKTAMLAEGNWRSEFPERESDVKGFHINGLYTPIGLGDSWTKHAAAWERAQGSQAAIQVFFNTRLGEVHKGERQRVEWQEIQRRAEPFALRQIQPGTLILTGGVDVQADRLEAQLLGHGRREAITVVDYAVFYGDTTRKEVWDQLDAYLLEERTNSFGVKMRLSCTLIDSGYLPETVLGFTRSRKFRGIFASRGSEVANRFPIGRPNYPDTKRRGKADTRTGVERYEIGVSVLKHWLFEQLRADAGTPEVPVQIADRHIRFPGGVPDERGNVVDGLQDEYYRQLTAEVWDPKHGWVKQATYHRNEALDTFLLGRAAAMHHSVNLHRMRESDFARLEQLYEPAGGVTKPTSGKVALPRVGGFFPTAAKAKPTEGDE